MGVLGGGPGVWEERIKGVGARACAAPGSESGGGGC